MGTSASMQTAQTANGLESLGSAPAVYGKNSQNSSPSYGRFKQPREKIRYGVVHAKITSFAYLNRRQSETEVNYAITPRGAIFFGSQSPPGPVQTAMANCGRPVLVPAEIPLSDSRANRLLVTYNGSWTIVPSQDAFSRHSGTCLILGDKFGVSPPYQMKVGDCFRLGSVGVVVSEIRHMDGTEERLDGHTLQYLKDEALALDSQEEMATLAKEEEEMWKSQQQQQQQEQEENNVASEVDRNSLGLTEGERFICYMCYETSNTAEDPLVAPCQCRGDTRYLHASCLQKWYNSLGNSHSRVLRVTSTGSAACKICGAAYKTSFRTSDGKVTSLLDGQPCPSLTLVVVTRHDTSPGLFNTRYRLRVPNFEPEYDPLQINSNNSITLGRSSSCDLVLDYRTVSTVHALVHYQNGAFYLTDKNSSNGTMVYLKDPLTLNFGSTLRIRMGRTTIKFQARRSWLASFRNSVYDTFSRKKRLKNANINAGSPNNIRTTCSSLDENEVMSEDQAAQYAACESSTTFLSSQQLLSIMSEANLLEHSSIMESLDRTDHAMSSNRLMHELDGGTSFRDPSTTSTSGRSVFMKPWLLPIFGGNNNGNRHSRMLSVFERISSVGNTDNSQSHGNNRSSAMRTTIPEENHIQREDDSRTVYINGEGLNSTFCRGTSATNEAIGSTFRTSGGYEFLMKEDNGDILEDCGEGTISTNQANKVSLHNHNDNHAISSDNNNNNNSTFNHSNNNNIINSNSNFKTIDDNYDKSVAKSPSGGSIVINNYDEHLGFEMDSQVGNVNGSSGVGVVGSGVDVNHNADNGMMMPSSASNHLEGNHRDRDDVSSIALPPARAFASIS